MRTEAVSRFRHSSQAAAPGHSSSCVQLLFVAVMEHSRKAYSSVYEPKMIRLTKTGEITTVHALNALSGYFVKEDAN